MRCGYELMNFSMFVFSYRASLQSVSLLPVLLPSRKARNFIPLLEWAQN